MGKGERTRQALLDSAVSRFAQDGFRATSVAEIARDARVSGTAAYVYFPSKEALFVAAVDQDTAEVIDEASAQTQASSGDNWVATLLVALVRALEGHRLARRILAGLEPDFTVRLLTIPALEELRKVSRDALVAGQATGEVRGDIDPEEIAAGLIMITLSLAMSLVQTGLEPAALGGHEVRAVFEAALAPPATPEGMA